MSARKPKCAKNSLYFYTELASESLRTSESYTEPASGSLRASESYKNTKKCYNLIIIFFLYKIYNISQKKKIWVIANKNEPFIFPAIGWKTFLNNHPYPVDILLSAFSHLIIYNKIFTHKTWTTKAKRGLIPKTKKKVLHFLYPLTSINQ